MRCHFVIGAHEPMVVVDERGALLTSPSKQKLPGVERAEYHRACYEAIGRLDGDCDVSSPGSLPRSDRCPA